MKLPWSRRTRFAAAIAVLSLLVVGVVSYLLLQDDDGSSTAPSRNQDNDSGLLPLTALPGSGWQPPIDSELSYIAPGLVLFSIPEMAECSRLRAFEERLQEADADFAGGTVRQFVRPAGSGTKMTVTHLRVAFTDSATPVRLVEEFRQSAGSSAIQSCLAAVVRRDEVDAEVATRDLATAPSGSVGKTTTVILKATPTVIAAAQVLVWWAEGDTLAVLSMAAAGPLPADREIARMVEEAATATRKAAPP